MRKVIGGYMEQAGYVDRTGQKATDCRCYRLPTYPLHRSQIFSTAHTTNFLDFRHEDEMTKRQNGKQDKKTKQQIN